MAANRQIVQRWNCRLKMSWGMMHDVYRGDRSKLPVIIMELIAITNYHIHPLNNEDDPLDDKTKDEKAQNIEEKSQPYSTTNQTHNTNNNHNSSATNTQKCLMIQLLFSIQEALETSAIQELTAAHDHEIISINPTNLEGFITVKFL